MGWDISMKFGMKIDFHDFERMMSLNLNSEVDIRLYDRHLTKSIWGQKSADVRPITTKFRREMQNDMHCRSKSKMKVKFQYGGRLSFETGSSFISAVDWDISSKFGMQIDLRFLKRVYLIEIA